MKSLTSKPKPTYARNAHKIFILCALLCIFIGALWLAHSATSGGMIQSVIQEFGYAGVLLAGIIAGLNTFVPIPAATFAPAFIAAGLSAPAIILTLALGTLIADYIGFVLGRVSREMIIEKYPKTFDFFTNLQRDKKKFILPVVVLFAAFVPFPNEAVIIPLALAGVRFSHLIIPLIIGNIIHQALLVYGITNVLQLLS